MQLSLRSTVDLVEGVAMPRLGLGTYKAKGEDVRNAVRCALELGYRGIDTASLYANESEIALGIADTDVPREELFITTKVWNEEQGYEGTRAALSRSLERLRTDHVDLYLVHWPMERHMEGTWRAMEELLAEGKTRAIGVCNHLAHHLDHLLGFANVAPAVDQVEFHPWLQQPALQTYLTENDIVLEAWAPVMKGRVAEEPLLVQIARRHGVTPAQVAIRWVLEQGYITIPKSISEERIAENASVFGFELDPGDLARLSDADRGQRLGPDPDTYAWSL